MKKNKYNYMIMLLVLFSLSCGDSDNDILNEPNNEITDDYKLVAVSDTGGIFEIGNNTGNIENIAQIQKESDNTFLSANSMIASEEKIYSIEYVYNPSPTNNLLIYDKQNHTTEIISLILPSSISGDDRGIVALTRNNNNLIGILVENIYSNNSTKHLININLEDNLVTDLGITFNEDRVSSMKKVNSKLYISTWGEGLIIVDLVTNLVSNLDFISGSRLAVINNSELGIMQAVLSSINGAKPEVFNTNTQTISENSNGESYGLITVSGNTIYEDGIYLNLVSSNSLNLYLGILKSNFETNENSIVEINTTDVNRNLIIVDVFHH